MGHTYIFSCKESEEKILQQAISYVNKKMCIIRDADKIKGKDRIAVIVALDIAAELLSTKLNDGLLCAGMTIAEWQEKVATIQTMLDDVLVPQEKLF